MKRIFKTGNLKDMRFCRIIIFEDQNRLGILLMPIKIATSALLPLHFQRNNQGTSGSWLLSRAVLIIVLAFLSFTEPKAQRYLSRNYTEADGLSSSLVYSIVQDSSGIIWIARRSGISSYNGTSFTNFSLADGLKPGTYSFLCIDEKGILWALRDVGELDVARFDGKKWISDIPRQDFKMRFGISFRSFDVCYIGGKPVFLVGSEKDGLFAFFHGRWKKYSTSNGLISNQVHAVRCLKGIIYVATEKGLTVIRQEVVSDELNLSKVLPSPNILCLEKDNDKLWMLGDNWLGTLINGKYYPVANDFYIATDLTINRVFLYADGHGNVFFGNPSNVYYYNGRTNKTESLGRADGLISEGGTSALVDREMNTWITGYRGITKISSKRFLKYSVTDGLFSNEVASAMEMSPGHYVFGHYCALSFLDGDQFSHLILDPKRMSGNYETRVLDLMKDQKGNIWCAVNALGIVQVDKNRRLIWYGEKSGLKGMAFSIAQLSDGKIYAGTSLGLFEFRQNRFVPVRMEGIPQIGIRRIFVDQDNSMLITSLSWGVIRYDHGKVSVYKSLEDSLARNTYSVLKDSEGRIWVGTAIGLFQFAGTVLKKVNLNGLSIGRPIYNIIEDQSGTLWFGTDNGLFRWNGSTLDHFAIRDGLSGQEINRGAGFVDEKNQVWIGTNNGLTVFRPEFDYDLSMIPAPKVKLLSLEAGEDMVSLAQNTVLPSDHCNLTIDFSIISFIDENKIYYKYQLENFDTAWSEKIRFTDNKIRFNNLKPGKYRFKLKACNALGIWSEPVISGTIKIRNPFWLQWWFILLTVGLFIAIAFIIGRFILITRYSAKLEEMVAIRTSELQESNSAKDNFFSIIAHDLKSPFNVILGMLDILTKDYNEYSEEERMDILLKLKNASVRTINLLENLLTWARAQKGLLPIVSETINISDLLDETLTLMESAAHAKNIRLFKSCDENILALADRNMTSTIIRNLISNAIKFTYPGGKVEIYVSRINTGFIEITVKDNGCGMSAKALSRLFRIDSRLATKGTRDEIGTGLGLILCKDFIEKNKGGIQVTSEEGKGSCFSFTLPVAKE